MPAALQTERGHLARIQGRGLPVRLGDACVAPTLEFFAFRRTANIFRDMITRNIGLKLLGLWLILTGILPFLNLHIPAISTILMLIAVFAGILILMGR